MSAGVSAQSTVAPRAVAFGSKISSQVSRLSRPRWRMFFAASRVPSKSSSSNIASRRLQTNLPRNFCRFCCSCASSRLACARSRKCIDATCIADSPASICASFGRSRGDFGDVQDSSCCVAATAQPSFDIEHAAEVAQDDGIGTAVGDVAALVVGHARRYVAELDREGSTKAAARLAIGHFGELHAGHLLEQRARLLLDAHLAQPGAAVVIGHVALVSSGNALELEHVDQEVGEFAGFRAERHGAREHRCIVAEDRSA